MAKLAAEEEVPVVLMHMQGTPATMQKEPKYKDVVTEVLEFLLQRAKYAQKMGIPKERIFIDPGIGFGKTMEHNILLLQNIDKFVATGYRVLVGTSRKAFLGKLTGKEKPAEQDFRHGGYGCLMRRRWSFNCSCSRRCRRWSMW